MKVRIVIEAEVERVQGLFASKDDIGGKIAEELESADPGTVYSDEDAEYEVTSWEVAVEA